MCYITNNYSYNQEIYVITNLKAMILSQIIALVNFKTYKIN